MSIHTKPDGRVFVVWYDPIASPGERPKQHTKHFGRGPDAQAEAEKFDNARKLERGKGTIEGYTVADLCKLYQTGHHVEESTARMDDYKFSACLVPVLGTIQADMLGSKDINRYVGIRKKDGVKNTTIGREVRLLKAVFSWAFNQDPQIIVRNPLAGYRLSLADDSEIPAPPTLTETNRILDVAEPHMVRALYLFWFTGIRPGGEMLRVTWGDVDFERGRVRIMGARKGGPVVRYVPFESEADTEQQLRDRLLTWKEQDEKVKGGEGISAVHVVHFRFQPVKSLKRAWKTAKARAGITRELRLYDLRHAFVSNLINEGTDYRTASELAGHSRPDTTMRTYHHTSEKQHREAVKRVPKLGQ